jgi:hypothetical protein
MPSDAEQASLQRLSETQKVEILGQVGPPQRRYDIEAPSSSLRNPCATSAVGVLSGRDVGSHKGCPSNSIEPCWWRRTQGEGRSLGAPVMKALGPQNLSGFMHSCGVAPEHRYLSGSVYYKEQENTPFVDYQGNG